jgi:hypothetical protein
MPLLHVVVEQVLEAQPLSQALVPEIQVTLFQQLDVVQVLAAQLLSAQTLVPEIQVRLFQHVVVLQVLAAQLLSAQACGAQF